MNMVTDEHDELLVRLRQIKLMVFDVDGVLTDGSLYYGPQGEVLKVFNALDGHGIKMLAQCGIASAIISGRQSETVAQRAKELGIMHVLQGIGHKLSVWQQLLSELALTPSECGFMGDDVIDLAVLSRVGFAACVPNAVESVRALAHWQTEAQGGRGAVREVCDLLLKAQGHYERLMMSYQEGCI